MNAAPARSSSATPSPIRLRTDVFDRLAAERGAVNKADMARLVGIDRTTLWRIRERKVTPTSETALQIAQRLGVAVEDLFEVTA